MNGRVKKWFPRRLLLFRSTAWAPSLPWPLCLRWISCTCEGAEGESSEVMMLREGQQKSRPSASLPGWSCDQCLENDDISVSSRDSAMPHYSGSWSGRAYLSSWLEYREINFLWVLLRHHGVLMTELMNWNTSVKMKVSRKSQLVIE